MSIKELPNNMLQVLCDGAGRGPCSNFYELPNTQQTMSAANERLQRWGWRTIVEVRTQLHFCRHCAAKDSRFNPRAPTKSKATKGAMTNSRYVAKGHVGRAR